MSEAEHATSRSRRLPTILTFTRGWGRNIFVSLKPPSPGTEPRTLAWKAAVLTTTLGPPPINVIQMFCVYAYKHRHVCKTLAKSVKHFICAVIVTMKTSSVLCLVLVLGLTMTEAGWWCGPDVDCKWTAWGAWRGGCGDGCQFRTRSHSPAQQCGGSRCTGDDLEHRICQEKGGPFPPIRYPSCDWHNMKSWQT